MSRAPLRIGATFLVAMTVAISLLEGGSIEVGPPGPGPLVVPESRAVVWEACLRVRELDDGTAVTLDPASGILVYGVAGDGSPGGDELTYYSVLIEPSTGVPGTVVHARVHHLAGGDSTGKALAFYHELLAELEHETER